MSTATTLAGGVLGAVAALPTARLAEHTMHHRPAQTRRIRLTLMLTTAAFAAAATARHGLPATSTLLLVLVPAAAAATVDAHEQRLPDLLTATTAVAVGAEIVVLLALGNSSGACGAWGFFVGTGACLAAKVAFTDAVGWGDVKLAPSLVALLAIHGWPTLYTGLLAWSGLVLLTAAHGIIRRRRAEIVAYGPALIGGTACAIALAS